MQNTLSRFAVSVWYRFTIDGLVHTPTLRHSVSAACMLYKRSFEVKGRFSMYRNFSNETFYDQESPFQSLIDTGTCVIRIPNRDTIAGIKSDIKFLATVLDAPEEGEILLEDFDAQLQELADIASKIPQEEHKRVYFEIAPAPNMYSCGSGSFINEMIEWIGAENVLADQSGWFTVEGETIVSANPDFIFTNADYMDDPVQEILDRDGWADISAIASKNVYSIDSNSSSHSNHTIVKAMRQMAEILYPDYYTTK